MYQHWTGTASQASCTRCFVHFHVSFVRAVALLDLIFWLLYAKVLANHNYGALRTLVDFLKFSYFALFLHSYQLGTAEARACDRWPPKAGGASPSKAAAPESSSLQQRIADLENDLVKVCLHPLRSLSAEPSLHPWTFRRWTLQLLTWTFAS